MRRLVSLRSLGPGAIINAVIALAVLVAVALIVLTVTGDDTQTASAAQTAKVDTGEVTATVSASGNIEAATTVNVNFEGSGGIIRMLPVEKGDHVRKGQVLARVDSTSARQTLRSAMTQLASARASYQTATQGQTAQERARDQQTVNVSRASVHSAEVSLRGARRTYALDLRQHNAAVQRAADAVTQAQDERDQAQQQYQNDPSPENQQNASDKEAAVSSAESALTSARDGRSSALVADQQQINTQRSAVGSARAQLKSTTTTVAVNSQPPRAGAVAAAQAQIDSAQVVVDQAQLTLDQTVLRAPTAGTVASIGGAVGQSSSSTSTGSESSSSETETSTAASTSGVVTLTGTRSLQVTANVAEADINDVKVGQQATITLPANDRRLTGVVSTIDTVETVTNNVVEYGVTMNLNEASGVKLGQTSDIEITTGTKQGVLRVASSALTTIGERTTATVRRQGGSTAVVTVQPGLEGDSQTEILGGLAEGDVVEVPEQSAGGADFTFPGGGLGGLGGPP